MAITPVSGADAVVAAAEPNEAAFDAALAAAEDGVTPEMLDMMVVGAIQIGGQMIVMPQVNELLKEAFAEDE